MDLKQRPEPKRPRFVFPHWFPLLDLDVALGLFRVSTCLMGYRYESRVIEWTAFRVEVWKWRVGFRLWARDYR